MPDLFDLSGPNFRPAAGGPPRQLVVILHGWGADGNDLISLAPYWARVLPHAEFLAPHGPFPCDAGFGRQWFSLIDRDPATMAAGLRAVAPVIDAYIDTALASRGLDDSKLALAGFSQGTMTALYVALRRERACACVLGYSGRLVAAEDIAAGLRAKPPILLVHGQADDIVPVEASRQAKEILTTLGVPVELQERPGLGHSIDELGLTLGARMLARAFAAGR
ncbi:MAG TPA: dienelactone hydrolase family protein [Alphaproteobacteria bacterium]|nr:dienelactone hydrolase family protein [Alphaproteobacteria bacterium]